MTRDLRAVQWRQNRIPYADRLVGLNRGPRKVPLEAVPVPVVNANRGPIPLDEWIGRQGYLHNKLEQLTAQWTVRRDRVEQSLYLVFDGCPVPARSSGQ